MEIVRGTDHYRRDWNDANTGMYVGIDFPTARRNGSRFTFYKRIDGASITPGSAELKAEADAAGHCNAPYGWVYSHNWVDINSQAQCRIQDLGNAPVYLEDFEDYLGMDFPKAPDLWGVLVPLRNNYRGKIGVYTRFDYWWQFANSDPAWLELIDFLVLADPDGNDSLPKIPAPFTQEHLKFKQDWWWGDPATWGIRNNKEAVDLDLFYGTEDEVVQFFGNGTIGVPEEPPVEGVTMQVTPKYADGSKIRSAAVVDGSNANQVGTLAFGAKLDVIGLTGASGSEQWVEVVWAGKRAYIAVWWNNKEWAILSGTLPTTTEPVKTHDVEVFSDGMISIDGGPRQ